MTERLVTGLDSDLQELAAFVLGELLAHKARRGELPIGASAGVDVEEFVNAVQDLRDRNDLELSAFVGSWHPRLEQLDTEGGSSSAAATLAARIVETVRAQTTRHQGHSQSPFQSHFVPPLHAPEFAREFRAAVREVMQGGGQGHRMRRLQETLESSLRKVCHLPSTAHVEYLQPLFNALPRDLWAGGTRAVGDGGIGRPREYAPILVIASLNYDNALEVAAERAGVSFDHGLEHWNQHRVFDTTVDVDPTFFRIGSVDAGRAAAVLILKLHGSIDWRLENDRLERRTEGKGVTPLIFGGRNKLTAEGPFLDLLMGFAKALDSATRLTAIGYSFRDPHVNAIIAKWRRRDDARVLRVVDPAAESFLDRDNDRRGRLAALSPKRPTLEIVPSRAEEALSGLFPSETVTVSAPPS